MGYEIDFLPVGEESSGGDAIALRYGNLHGHRSEQTVIVIDGGYNANGEALVDHIRRYYGTDRVDIVVSTHTDQDHITGLEVVLEKMQVGKLLMHLPWNHSCELTEARRTAFKSAALSEKLEKSFQAASDLQAIRGAKGRADRRALPGSRHKRWGIQGARSVTGLLRAAPEGDGAFQCGRAGSVHIPGAG